MKDYNALADITGRLIGQDQKFVTVYSAIYHRELCLLIIVKQNFQPYI